MSIPRDSRLQHEMEAAKLEEIPSIIMGTGGSPHAPGETMRQAIRADLDIRLTKMLTEAVGRLVDASNSNTRTMGRLAAVGVGLTGAIAAATVTGMLLSAPLTLPWYVDIAGIGVSVVLIVVCVVFAKRLWPSDC